MEENKEIAIILSQYDSPRRRLNLSEFRRIFQIVVTSVDSEVYFGEDKYSNKKEFYSYIII